MQYSLITVKRTWKTGKSTIGCLAFNGLNLYTLEDVVREPGVKVPGETAIPPGRYEVIIDMSTRFGKLMPHILNVPGFEGIRIHSGNTAADTEGCLLLGLSRAVDVIQQSRNAIDQFMPELEAALKLGKVYIDIS